MDPEDARVAAELRIHRSELRRSGDRGLWHLPRRPQPPVELRGREVDVVAKCLVAEGERERHDPPIRPPLDSGWQVGRRVKNHRRVFWGQMHTVSYHPQKDELLELRIRERSGCALLRGLRSSSGAGVRLLRSQRSADGVLLQLVRGHTRAASGSRDDGGAEDRYGALRGRRRLHRAR